MTTYPHELTECENCGTHYCMGCVGEECPNCKLKEVAFYAIKLEQKLEAVKDILKIPECKSAMNTPDIILGFEEQFYLKKTLEIEDDDDS